MWMDKDHMVPANRSWQTQFVSIVLISQTTLVGQQFNDVIQKFPPNIIFIRLTKIFDGFFNR